MPISARAGHKAYWCRWREPGAGLLAVEHRCAALLHYLLWAANRVRRVYVDDVATTASREKHAYRGEMLFDSGLCKARQQALDITGDMNGLHMSQVVHAALSAEIPKTYMRHRNRRAAWLLVAECLR